MTEEVAESVQLLILEHVGTGGDVAAVS